MKNIELRPDELDFAVKFWALSKEEKEEILPKLTGCQKRFFRRFTDFYNYKIIAEVVQAKNCIRNAKPGDKMVFGGMGGLIYDESSLHCTWAASSMFPVILSITDRIMDGLEPYIMGIDHVKCPGLEPEEGGTGSVIFKIKVINEKYVQPEDEHRPGVDNYFSEK
jgi:uncharacterized repeat protein (TIGR04076 family)